MRLLKLLTDFKKWFIRPGEGNVMPDNHIDAICPKCDHMTEHEIIRVFTYRCLTCGNDQDKFNALTREETSW